MNTEKTFEASAQFNFIQNGCLVDKICLYYDHSTDEFTDNDGCSYFEDTSTSGCAERFILTAIEYFDSCRGRNCDLDAFFRTTIIGNSEDEDSGSLWKVTIPAETASYMDHDDIFDELINHYIFRGSDIVVGKER